jgi:hypothetical protein
MNSSSDLPSEKITLPEDLAGLSLEDLHANLVAVQDAEDRLGKEYISRFAKFLETLGITDVKVDFDYMHWDPREDGFAVFGIIAKDGNLAAVSAAAAILSADERFEIRGEVHPNNFEIFVMQPEGILIPAKKSGYADPDIANEIEGAKIKLPKL